MKPENLSKIRHLVVLMQENRSFDQVLGFRLGVNGVRNTIATGPMRESRRHSRFNPGPPHSSAAVKVQINGGLMNGFVEAYVAPPGGKNSKPKDPLDVMRYYRPEDHDLPVTNFLADRFAVCDNWFSSIPTSTMPNRLYSMAGQADGERETPVGVSVDVTTVFDLLDERGVSWAIYGSHLSPLLFVGNWPKKLHYFRKIRPMSQLKVDSAEGTLPTVCWVDPRWNWMRGGNDDHPPAPVEAGQNLIREAYLSVRSKAHDVWDTTVFILNYDEHGGFYDHVTPPKVPIMQADGFSTMGPRVPAIVVSPYVDPGSVCSAQLDHCSTLKFVCEWQGLDPRRLSKRVGDNGTVSLAAVLTDIPKAVAPDPPPEVVVPEVVDQATETGEDVDLKDNFVALLEGLKQSRKELSDLRESKQGAFGSVNEPLNELSDLIEAISAQLRASG